MKRVLVIGAGAAGSVVVKKLVKHAYLFGDIHLASRNLASCETIKKACNNTIFIHQVDADHTQELITLLQRIKPDLLIHMALPYQNLSIMQACLDCGVHYIDTANYEAKDKTGFYYQPQWDYNDAFKEKGLMALLGCGFDPGVTNVFCAYAHKHIFDEIYHIDIIDCNDGHHHHPFATNFNPEINIREITQKGKYWKENTWIETDPMAISKHIDFPEIGKRKAYLLYHEELESLVKHIPYLKQIRFWMTFSEDYLNYLNVLEKVGMTSIKPISYQGQDIVPLQFLKALLPKATDLASKYQGKTCIGCIIDGIKEGKAKKVILYNICDHQHCFNELQAHAVSYSTGVPAMIGALLMSNGSWFRAGVHHMETFDPDPYMDALMHYGLPWKIVETS